VPAPFEALALEAELARWDLRLVEPDVNVKIRIAACEQPLKPGVGEC